jgi:hypothetical protein
MEESVPFSGPTNVGNTGKTKRDRLKNIQSRIASGVRNTKNERELRDKLRHFQKKIDDQTFKPFMIPRRTETEALLQDLERLPPAEKAKVKRAIQQAPVNVPSAPVNVPVNAPVNVPVNAPSVNAPSAEAEAEAIENNKYLLKAARNFTLPEFYDPFTGRKFGPAENPMPPIESAYTMLKSVRAKALRRAATLKRKEAKNKKNNSVNTRRSRKN